MEKGVGVWYGGVWWYGLSWLFQYISFFESVFLRFQTFQVCFCFKNLQNLQKWSAGLFLILTV